MRIIQSIWSPPMINDRWGIKNQVISNIWLYALSVNYIKKLGFEAILHTDDYGKEFFSFLPYDDIFLTLNEIKNNSQIFWAQGKMLAYQKENLNTIHIDGDVFLKKETLKNILEFDNYDLICQNYEYPKEYIDKEIEDFYYNEFKTDLFNNNNLSINCGLIGFNNQDLKNEYINGYVDFRDKLLLNEKFMKKFNNKRESPDLIIEQIWLQTVCFKNNFKVKTILPIKGDDTLQKISIDIGYTHLLGLSKYQDFYLDQVKNRLKLENNELYEKVINKINKLI